MMRNKTLITLLFAEIFLLLALLVHALRLWLYPFLWGWPTEIHQRSIILLLFVLLISVATILVGMSSRVETGGKIIALGALLIITLTLGWFIALHLPLAPAPTSVLSSAGIDEASFSTLSPCDKLEHFANVGYQLLDIDHSVVLVPEWMHKSLREIPKDVLVNCIAQVGSRQISLMAGPFAKDEIPIRKVHALVFESISLGVEDSSAILNLLEVMVCQKDYDLVDHLALEYYFAKNHALPDFETYSDAGAKRLRSKACAQ